MINRELYTPGLLEQIRVILHRLAPLGWNELFLCHGLNITKPELKEELSRPLRIDRSQPGFEDFALEGNRGIEPCQPALSLLFHGLASPQVVSYHDNQGQPKELLGYPILEEICVIENYVYGAVTPSIHELRVRAGNAALAIVVFSSEYRPAVTTIHQKHADKCFSRVGVSRVGTAPALYLEKERGYLPFDNNNPYAYRVIPTYYSVYIAVKVTGNEKNFGPMRFQQAAPSGPDENAGDGARDFWVPLHKLFSGNDCIRGFDLRVRLTATHVNEKIRRIHKALAGLGYNTGWHEPDLSNSPFIFREGIADLTLFNGESEGLLIPVSHPGLVKAAEYKGKTLTYLTPVKKDPFRSSVIISSRSNGARPAPEYVYARHQLLADGALKKLSEEPGVIDAVREGGYPAVHYQDFTGDGCIEAECPELAFYLPELKAAYSMVSAVDFFPLVKQYDLINWWNQAVPEKLNKTIWPSNPGPPLSLSDTRYPANLTLTTTKLDITDENKPRKVFEPDDNTISAIVGLYQSCAGKLTRIDDPKNKRISSLPDGAAGVFAPGWDCSIDRTDESDPDDNGGPLKPGVTFFNNYGLGSPFPEDSMLCAALSSFWPAAAPDITRSFAPGNYATATPLPDDIIGIEGARSWNGIPGPVIIDRVNKLVEFYRIEYGDFIQAALDNRFDFSQISRITSEEYGAATLVMARVYGALEALTTEQKKQWVVYSFRKAPLALPQRQEAEKGAGVSLSLIYTYRFEIFKALPTDNAPADFRKKWVRFDEMEIFFADPQNVIQKTANGWSSFRY